MKTKQEFLDEVAKDFYLRHRNEPNSAPRADCAAAAYCEAEALWEERERRRKDEKTEWPTNTLYESFEMAYPSIQLGRDLVSGGYIDDYIDDLFKAYSAGFFDCSDRFVG